MLDSVVEDSFVRFAAQPQNGSVIEGLQKHDIPFEIVEVEAITITLEYLSKAVLSAPEDGVNALG